MWEPTINRLKFESKIKGRITLAGRVCCAEGAGSCRSVWRRCGRSWVLKVSEILVHCLQYSSFYFSTDKTRNCWWESYIAMAMGGGNGVGIPPSLVKSHYSLVTSHHSLLTSHYTYSPHYLKIHSPQAEKIYSTDPPKQDLEIEFCNQNVEKIKKLQNTCYFLG